MKKWLIVWCFVLATVSVSYSDELFQTVGNVKVRSEASLEAEVVSYLKQGVIVKKLDEKGSWIKVQSPIGTTGWVHKSMLRAVGADQLSMCKGVEGFSAVCPVEEKKSQTDSKEQVSTFASGSVPINKELKTPAVSPHEKAQIPSREDLERIKIPEPTVSGEFTPPKHLNGRESFQDMSKQAESKGFVISQPEVSYSEGVFGTSYIVEPERTTAVYMSSSDVNRIVCPLDIRDVVYSEEKGIQVKVVGRNAFVKFLIRRIAGKDTYSTVPVDLYVVCGNSVYSIIAFPQRIPAVTVYLEDKSGKLKQTVEKYQGMPLEKKIVEIVKSFFTDKIPPEALFTVVNKEFKVYSGLEIKQIGQYVIEGEGIMIKVFSVRMIDSQRQYIDIREKDFMRKEFTEAPLAISADRLRLYKGDKSRVLIIERVH